MSRDCFKCVLSISIIALIVCVISDAYVGNLQDNYKLISFGYNNDTCVTISYGSQYTSVCRIYAIEQCTYGNYSTYLMDNIVPCTESILRPYLDREPINSKHVRYYFNARNNEYYSLSDLNSFINKYGKDPYISVAALNSSMFIFIILAMVSIIKLCMTKHTHSNDIEMRAL